MARNEEKANSLLNRWQALRGEMASGTDGKRRRPFIASECQSLPQAEKWRREIVKEVAQLVRKIQNAALGEHVVRDLNDEINRKLREKHHWDKQILALGGPNYLSRQTPAELDGKSLPGKGFYKYFGAAKSLPGVRELFEKKDAVEKPRRSRGDIFKNIGPDYFGWRDEEDGILLPAEAEVEERLRDEAIRAAPPAKRLRGGAAPDEDDDAVAWEPELVDSGVSAAAAVPDQDRVEQEIVERKKQELLARYVLAEGATSKARA